MEKIINHTFQGKRIYYGLNWGKDVVIAQYNEPDGYKFRKTSLPWFSENAVALWIPSKYRKQAIEIPNLIKFK